jgi:predicted nucleotide-binding protein
MLDRFEGSEGRRKLIDVLCRQMVVEGNADIAAHLADKASLKVLADNEHLIHQDKSDTEVHFVVLGRVRVLVKGTEVAIRTVGQHVGEMAMIDPTAKRCATVVADGEAVVASVPEPIFAALAHKHPELWRRLALELAARLRQRNSLVRPTNPRPVLFLGSSAEALKIVRVIETGLAYDNILVKPWNRIFEPSKFPVDDLIAMLEQADFAAFVISADDLVTSRKKRNSAPRDNVVFELGMAMGQMGRERSLLIQDAAANLKIPSDLTGINPLKYKVGPEGDLAAALGPAINDLRGLIIRKGCR